MEIKENKPLVSVIIPTYNRAGVIGRAVESVQAQTFSDWEVIISDDGSTDETEKIVKKIQESDTRIIYIKNEKNRGVSVARNIAITQSKGEYVAFLDSDDIWLGEKLEKQLEVFKKGDEKLGLVYTSAFFINSKTGESRIKKATIGGDIWEEQLAHNIVGGTSRVMVKRECLEVCGNFDENISCNEDWDLWIRIAKKYSIALESTPLVRYFEGNEDSLSVNGDKLINGYKALWQKYDLDNMASWIRGAHYVRLGHRLFYHGDVLRGRKYLGEAFFLRPWNAKYAILFLLSFFGLRFYRQVTFLAMKI